MCLPTLMRVSAETSLSFAVKNSFLFIALDNVRRSLQRTITEIALPKLGRFVAPIVGTQLGTICAIPVTQFMADMLIFGIKETVRSVHDLFRSIVYGEKPPRLTPFVREVAMSITSFALGFIAKSYFCNYGMGHVGHALRIVTGVAAPLCGATLAVSCLAPAVIALAAPAMTFIAGDILASVVSSASYALMDRTFRCLFDRRKT